MRTAIGWTAVVLCAFSARGRAAPAELERGVDEALMVYVPPGGLQALGDVLERALSVSFPIEATADSFPCSDTTSLSYAMSELSVQLSMDEVRIVPSNGEIDLDLFATLTSTPGTLEITEACVDLDVDLGECELRVPNTAIEAHITVELDMVGDAVTVSSGPLFLDVSPIRNPISECTLEPIVQALIESDEEVLNDFLFSSVQSTLDELPGMIEEELQSALSGLTFGTELDVLGAPLALDLATSRIDITPDGMILGLSADIATEVPGRCVDATQVPPPLGGWLEPSEFVPGTSLAYDAGLFLAQDFVSELMVAVWGTELFCMEFEEFGGLTLRGDLIGNLFDSSLTELIGADTPARLKIGSVSPPAVRFDDDQPVIHVLVDPLDIDLVSDLDHRQARLLQVQAGLDIGVDLGIDDEGMMEPTLVLDPDAIQLRESYSAFTGPGYSQGLSGLIGSVLGGLVPTEPLASVSVALPLGLELGALDWVPSDDGRWQGGHALLDVDSVQPIAVSGCSGASFSCDGSSSSDTEFDLGDALGCDAEDGGCGGDSGTCASGRILLPTWPWAPGMLLLGFVAVRRRREE